DLSEARKNYKDAEETVNSLRASTFDNDFRLSASTTRIAALEEAARLVLQSHTSELEEAQSGLSTIQATLAIATNE
ncbi:hypothetical protein DXG01_016577, partial [Tephrocybe rancida]